MLPRRVVVSRNVSIQVTVTSVQVMMRQAHLPRSVIIDPVVLLKLGVPAATRDRRIILWIPRGVVPTHVWVVLVLVLLILLLMIVIRMRMRLMMLISIVVVVIVVVGGSGPAAHRVVVGQRRTQR